MYIYGQMYWHYTERKWKFRTVDGDIDVNLSLGEGFLEKFNLLGELGWKLTVKEEDNIYYFVKKINK